MSSINNKTILGRLDGPNDDVECQGSSVCVSHCRRKETPIREEYLAWTQVNERKIPVFVKIDLDLLSHIPTEKMWSTISSDLKRKGQDEFLRRSNKRHRQPYTTNGIWRSDPLTCHHKMMWKQLATLVTAHQNKFSTISNTKLVQGPKSQNPHKRMVRIFDSN